METKLITVPAPDFAGGRYGQETGYPSKGRKLGPAWQEIWDRLRMASDALDGRVLADEVAPRHDLSPSTLVALLSRAAKSGLLTREPRFVTTGRGQRARTFYRINKDQADGQHS
jgi:hypothetical protein